MDNNSTKTICVRVLAVAAAGLCLRRYLHSHKKKCEKVQKKSKTDKADKADKTDQPETIHPRFKLFYWPGFPGRGEFMRLIFAETNTPYDDVYAHMTFQEATETCYGNPDRFAVPAIQDTCTLDPSTGEGLCLSQSTVIMEYLAEHCSSGLLLPKGVDKYKASVLMADIADLVEEGCRAWHALDYNKSYGEQAAATRPFIDYYVNRRLPKWLNRFDRVLRKNNADLPVDLPVDLPAELSLAVKFRPFFLVGRSISYVDLALFLVLDGVRSEVGSADGVCAAAYEQHASPLVKCFMRHMENRPRVKERVKVRPPFSQTGPLF